MFNPSGQFYTDVNMQRAFKNLYFGTISIPRTSIRRMLEIKNALLPFATNSQANQHGKKY